MSQLRRSLPALVLLCAAACGRGSPSAELQNQGTPVGTPLVVGTSVEEWGILVIPRRGGPASLRAPDRPGDTLWVGARSLPAARVVYGLSSGSVVLVTAAGKVWRYTPGTDQLAEAGRTGGEAAWESGGDQGVFLDVAAESALQVSTSGSWTYPVSETAEWAAPVEAGAGVVLERAGGTGRLRIVRSDTSAAAEELAVEVGRPGLVTAWGKRLALAGRGQAANSVTFFSVEPLAATGTAKLDKPVTLLRASPSSHALYVVTRDPPRVTAVNRFTLSQRELAVTDRPLQDLRTAMFGDFLLAWTGSDILLLSLDGQPTMTLEGDWRGDLPLGLSGGRVLVARGDRVFLADMPRGKRFAREPFDVGSADAFWLPIRWRPRDSEPSAPARVARMPVADSEEDSALSAAGDPSARPDPARPGGPTRPGTGRPGSAGSRDDLPLGYYAIVGSALQGEGITALVRSLAEAGYPTTVQRFSDDAGQLWYRGLVGPFATRSGADAAARQLERERGLQTWVTRAGGRQQPTGPV